MVLTDNFVHRKPAPKIAMGYFAPSQTAAAVFRIQAAGPPDTDLSPLVDD